MTCISIYEQVSNTLGKSDGFEPDVVGTNDGETCSTTQGTTNVGKANTTQAINNDNTYLASLNTSVGVAFKSQNFGMNETMDFITKVVCTSFEEAIHGVSNANASISSNDIMDKTPATNSNVDAPSTYASKISPLSSKKANFWFIDEIVTKDTDYDVVLPIGSV